jgi:hypothetical protein
LVLVPTPTPEMAMLKLKVVSRASTCGSNSES